MDGVRALRVYTSKRDPVSNVYRKVHSKGTEFQPSGVHTNKGEPIANRQRKNYSLRTQEERTVYGQRLGPPGAYK